MERSDLGGSWRDLGEPRGVWEGVRGGIPGVLGGPVGGLGRSWGALGALLGALGPLLAALGSLLARHAKIINKSMPKMTDLSSQEGGQMPPKSIPKATENRCKDETQKKHS